MVEWLIGYVSTFLEHPLDCVIISIPWRLLCIGLGEGNMAMPGLSCAGQPATLLLPRPSKRNYHSTSSFNWQPVNSIQRYVQVCKTINGQKLNCGRGGSVKKKARPTFKLLLASVYPFPLFSQPFEFKSNQSKTNSDFNQELELYLCLCLALAWRSLKFLLPLSWCCHSVSEHNRHNRHMPKSEWLFAIWQSDMDRFNSKTWFKEIGPLGGWQSQSSFKCVLII